jgi:hypothetical protein
VQKEEHHPEEGVESRVGETEIQIELGRGIASR